MKPTIISHIRSGMGIACALVCFFGASASAQTVLPGDSLVLHDSDIVVGRLNVQGNVSIRVPLSMEVNDSGSVAGSVDSAGLWYIRPAAGAVVTVSECRLTGWLKGGLNGTFSLPLFDTLQTAVVTADSAGDYIFETFGLGAPDSSLWLLYSVTAENARPYTDMILKYSGEASQHDMVLSSMSGIDAYVQGFGSLHGSVSTACKEPDSGGYHMGLIVSIPACTVVVMPSVMSILADYPSATAVPAFVAITDSLGEFSIDSIPFSYIHGYAATASFDVMANKSGWGFGRASVLLHDGACDTVRLQLSEEPIALSDDGLSILDTDIWKVAYWQALPNLSSPILPGPAAAANIAAIRQAGAGVLSLSLPCAGNLSVEVFSLNGRSLLKSGPRMVSAGTQQLSLGHFAQPVIARVTAPGYSGSLRLMPSGR